MPRATPMSRGSPVRPTFHRTVGLAHAGADDVFVAKVRPDGAALVYSGFIGGGSYDGGQGIAVDAAGSAYVTGYTDFGRLSAHRGPAPMRGKMMSSWPRFDPDGAALVYSGFIGGSSYDVGQGIAVDAAGNAYVTGRTMSADFPRTVGLAHAGEYDVFVAKVRPDGAALVYSGFIGGSAV